jgi:selenocysteine lyase/cysteine desulfurase
MATVAKNIRFEKGDEILVLDEQFPSNYYVWKALEKDSGVVVKTIKAPQIAHGRSVLWNQAILEAISPKTKVVSIPNVHWTDGTLFNLKKIRNRSDEVGAFLIIDGTQSIGALPFSVQEIRPDALVCAGYKWLMGSYGLGVAYFGERFDTGAPIENNWINHEGSENFSELVNYNLNFKAKAARYDMGESSNFILTPMLSEAIRQLLEWTPSAVQEYCAFITSDFLPQLLEKGYFIEDPKHRGQHLFGIYAPKSISMDSLKKKIAERKVIVSHRGQAIRVSPNVYNTKKDIEKLISCFI